MPAKRRRLPRVRVVERKLGREGAVGLCYQGLGLIEVDPRQNSKDYLDTLVHEMLHHFFPRTSEWRVGKIANRMTDILWKNKYRRLMD
jgi:hypothetical protein